MSDQYRLIRDDGKEIVVSDRALVVRNSAGDVLRIIGGISDITSERAAEEARLHLEKQLRHSQKLGVVGLLTSGITHDFNNVLGAIISYMELMLMDMPKEAAGRSGMEVVLRAGNRARSLIDQIRTYMRREEEKRVLMRVPPLVEESISLLRKSTLSTISFDLHFGEQLPSVFADATQLQQIILNLVTNATHAMDGRHGSVVLTLERVDLKEPRFLSHGALRVGLFLKLSVKDNGCGMTSETVEHIFEPFFTTKEVGKGSGLGLPSVANIVKSYNGAIHVQTLLGRGTTFELFFPGIDEDALVSVTNASQLRYGRGQHLLVVDDEPGLADVTSQLLRRIGYRATSFDCPQAVIKWIRSTEEEFELLLTDFAMPKLNGEKLARAVIRHRPGVKVLLLSGVDCALTPERMKAAGINRFLKKPFILADLSCAVDEILKSPSTSTL